MTFPLPELGTLFILTFARIGTLVMLLPGTGETMVPTTMRLGFALLLTLVLFPITRTLLPVGGGPAAVVGTLLGEIAVGLILGLATRMIIMALQIAGYIISQQIGLAYAMSVNPAVGGQDAAIGNFLTLLGITLVFAADIHHVALAAIRDSYALMPPVGVPDMGDAARLALRAIGRGFSLAVQISAPFIVFSILFNAGLGIVSRLMPQMQIFFVAVPLTVLIGMLLLVATIGLMMTLYVGDLGRFLAGYEAR